MAEERRKIALGIDDSEHAAFAFDWYVENVFREGDFLVCINIPEIHELSVSNPAAAGQQIKESNDHTTSLVQKYEGKMKANKIEGKVMMGNGKPGEVICRIAEQEHCTIIVSGTRGLGTIRRTVMGSVSDYIVHHAKCPVLVCRK